MKVSLFLIQMDTHWQLDLRAESKAADGAVIQTTNSFPGFGTDFPDLMLLRTLLPGIKKSQSNSSSTIKVFYKINVTVCRCQGGATNCTSSPSLRCLLCSRLAVRSHKTQSNLNTCTVQMIQYYSNAGPVKKGLEIKN